MKTKSIPFIIILVIGATCLWSRESKTHCSVTYITNDGFLFETKTGKVLIDALFGGIKGNWCDQPDDSVSTLMLNGIGPLGLWPFSSSSIPFRYWYYGCKQYRFTYA